MNSQGDVIGFSCIVSCLCPISFSKVAYPVRGRDCCHLRFFDKDSFLELYGRKGGGPCPICSKYIRVDDLVWDEYIQIQLNTSSPDAENISVKQDCIVCPEELVNEVDIIDITRQTPPERSNPVSRPQLTQYYKTEDNRYVSIPSSSFSFADYLFQRGIECEARSRIQRSLEMKYWKYMEFYSSVISKAFHLLHSDASRKPFIVFYQPSTQQLSAIQEVVDTVGVYSLVIGKDILVILDGSYIPTEYEETELLQNELSIDDYIVSKSV